MCIRDSSAINKASASLKSYTEKYKNSGDDLVYTIPDTIDASVTYFKGMYKDFKENRISLKVWDGNRWNWMDCRFCLLYTSRCV